MHKNIECIDRSWRGFILFGKIHQSSFEEDKEYGTRVGFFQTLHTLFEKLAQVGI